MSSPARGALLAALRRAEQVGLTEARFIDEVLEARTLLGAHDIASVLHQRLREWMTDQRAAEVDGHDRSGPVETAIAELDALIGARLAEETRERHIPEVDEDAWRALLARGEPVVER